jgi:predicted deacylase
VREPGRYTSVLEGTADGHDVRVPFIEIIGVDAGPVLSIVAGVHGSEYPGIVAAVRFSTEIDFNRLRGTIRIVPVLNVPAFYGRTEAVCPVDGKNPNRVFPGNPDGSYSDVMNHLVFSRVVEGSDCVVNVHGGDIFEALVPYGGIGSAPDTEVVERSRELARAYDFPFLVTFESKSSSSYGYDLNTAAMHAGIPAFLAESGGNGLLEDEFVEVHLKGFRNLVAVLEMSDDKRYRQPVREVETRELVSNFWRASHEGLFTPLVALGDSVHEGQEIGTITDWFGAPVHSIIAPRDAYIIAIVTTPAAGKDAIVFQVAF